ncbi:mannitol dehydrogenase family protein [Luedemannella helvata]|uniref:Mannitol-1-phosphate 5-dehydrogenase n=1 Tax=Luedemannella helvata TaxID=349315 RepID=A0ABP4XB70_9ACTN
MGRVSERLSLRTVGRVPAGARPAVLPGDVRAGIAHLGLGAFHRAHQAVYTEAAIAAGGGSDWAIVGVAPRSRDVLNAIAEQDGLFSVVTLDDGGARAKVLGAFAGLRHAASDPAGVVGLLADPDIRVVTLTVTEKAYALDPATGTLRDDPQVRADLTTDRAPTTVPGLLVAGLRARAAADAGPVALASCDNLPTNGERLRGLITQALALAGDDRAAAWVGANVSFPSTMVDRIVPATTADTLARAEAALGVVDLAPVAAEPFMQWVIEDDFPGGRPAWDLAGATMTTDTTPYEHLKLRALNGVHSTMAYLGALAGREYIADALALPGMADLLRRMIAEDIAPSLRPPAGVSVIEYGESVLSRFANPALGHRTLQVAMDGTQKLPQRVLHGMLERRAAGASPRWGALVVAAWMRFAAGRADDGRELPLDDPLAGPVRAALAAAGGKPDEIVGALLDLRQVFPAELAEDEVVRGLITGWLTDLTAHGAATTVAGAR